MLFSVYPNFHCWPELCCFPDPLPEVADMNIKMGVLVQEGADDLPETHAYIDLAHEFNAEDRKSLKRSRK